MSAVCLLLCQHNQPVFRFESRQNFWFFISRSFIFGFMVRFSGSKVLTNRANANLYAVSSWYTYLYYSSVTVSAANAKRGKTNQNSFAHIFGKSKFAKPFPFNTTNCSRLLSTSMVVVDIREVGSGVIVCLFVRISFAQTASKFVDGKAHYSGYQFLRAWVCFHSHRKMIKIFEQITLENHYLSFIMEKSSLKVRMSERF